MTPYLYEVARRLVAFNTVSNRSNAEAMAYLANHLEDHGFRVALQHTDPPEAPKVNLVASAGPPEPDGLILCGHVDTVPFEGQPGWERDPLHLEVEGERLYGRGISDMKAFLAQCLDAAARLDRSALKRPLILIFTADEEVGCLGAARLVPTLSQMLAPIPLPRLAWIGEPTSYRIFHTHKGVVLFCVKIQGRGGHSSVPERGVNAIAIAGQVIEILGRYQAELRSRRSEAFASLFPESPYTTLNLGTIRGGTAPNMIAEECSLQVSYRPLPETDPREAYREISRRLGEADLRDWGSPDLRATVRLGEPFVVPPLLSPRGTRLEKALFEVLGQRESSGAPFATDGCQFARAGIASLICGPGDLAEAHQPNESISRAAFERGTEVILAAVRRLCQD